MMNLLNVTLTAALLLGFATAAAADEHDHQAHTDPETAGPAFALQGEYVGQTTDGNKSFGAHVIALGDGGFRVVGYHGGLPGEGWNRGDETVIVDAELGDGKLTAKLEKADIEISDGGITVLVDGNLHATLDKIERKSPTLGKDPPRSAVVLFDGTTADNFDGGKLVDGKWLAASGCASRRKFGDHELHIEFRTPFMPAARGQSRGNSGVYVQGRYELQVLDSFGLDGKNNECGGIYSIAEPIVNMCYPPLTWQTYDIDFTAARYDDDGKKTEHARVTIRHNGVVIHDDLELPHGTPGYHGEGPEKDALFLQDHGNPVVFRNIWVVEK